MRNEIPQNMHKFIGGLLLAVIIPSTPHTIQYQNEPQEVELTIEGKIIKKANEYGLDPNVMLAIARAESNFKNVCNYLYDGEDGYRTACGVFMITRSTWGYYCEDENIYENRMDIDKNIECAMVIASESGLHHWNESKQNWL